MKRVELNDDGSITVDGVTITPNAPEHAKLKSLLEDPAISKFVADHKQMSEHISEEPEPELSETQARYNEESRQAQAKRDAYVGIDGGFLPSEPKEPLSRDEVAARKLEQLNPLSREGAEPGSSLASMALKSIRKAMEPEPKVAPGTKSEVEDEG